MDLRHLQKNRPRAVRASATNLEGDGQADLAVHGGPDKAINVYPADHHPYSLENLGIEMPHGAFGENFTTLGAVEADVCLGDIYSAGTVTLEVTQSREPCWKLARKWRVKDLAARVDRTGKTGWYFRVLTEGTIEAPADLRVVARGHPECTALRAHEVMCHRKDDRQAAAELAALPCLSAIWREALFRRAAGAGI